MLTLFGKFCRKLRIDNGELLKNMADKLEVTSSYLSAVENGKRNVPQNWISKITELYSLNKEQYTELKEAALESRSKFKKIDIQGLSNEDIAFAREFKELDEEMRTKIKNLLLKNKEGKGN